MTNKSHKAQAKAASNDQSRLMVLVSASFAASISLILLAFML